MEFKSTYLILYSKGNCFLNIKSCLTLINTQARDLTKEQAEATRNRAHENECAFYFLLPASVFNYKASFIILLVHTGYVILQVIAADTEKRVGELMKSSEENIDEGENKVKFCGETFNELSSYITELNQRVVEISKASSEQSQGITEIINVIQQLETSNLKNHESLKVSVDVSERLTGLSNDLGELVSKLNSKNVA